MCPFYFLSYGILTCITFLWFSIHSGVVRSARFCAPVFRHDDCLRSPSFSNPSFSSFAPLHCRAHTPFINCPCCRHACSSHRTTNSLVHHRSNNTWIYVALASVSPFVVVIIHLYYYIFFNFLMLPGPLIYFFFNSLAVITAQVILPLQCISSSRLVLICC